jgi:hypothetical protein
MLTPFNNDIYQGSLNKIIENYPELLTNPNFRGCNWFGMWGRLKSGECQLLRGNDFTRITNSLAYFDITQSVPISFVKQY